eukprot:6718674-Pyramimonas_sp.AAC.1
MRWARGAHARSAAVAFGGAPYVATKRCHEPRASSTTDTFEGVPNQATKRCTGNARARVVGGGPRAREKSTGPSAARW